MGSRFGFRMRLRVSGLGCTVQGLGLLRAWRLGFPDNRGYPSLGKFGGIFGVPLLWTYPYFLLFKPHFAFVTKLSLNKKKSSIDPGPNPQTMKLQRLKVVLHNGIRVEVKAAKYSSEWHSDQPDKAFFTSSSHANPTKCFETRARASSKQLPLRASRS